MRNIKKAAYLCTVTILLMTAGCGQSDTNTDLSGSATDTGIINDVMDAESGERNSIEQNMKENIDDQPGSDEGIDNEETEMQQPDNMQSGNAQSGDDWSDNTYPDNMQSDNTQSSNMQSDNSQLQSDIELDGSIKSIADNSVVVNKIFHPSANMSIVYGDGAADAPEDSLVTVYFSGETEFEVWTVKNSGVNGDADTEKRQGTFSDLKQDHIINLTGSYDGNDFYANHVIMYNFI